MSTSPSRLTNAPTVTRVEYNVAQFDGAPIDRVTLVNASGMEVTCLSYGGIIERVRVPDRHGVLADVVLGFDRVEDYLTDQCYFGALIGRYANRIAGARFVLDGQTHLLEPNDGANHLHGGSRGFHARVWQLEVHTDHGSPAIRLTLHSPDGDAGYPGAVEARVTYTLSEDNTFCVDYEGTTDRATPFSLTQHSYFNLAGGGNDVLAHELTLAANHFTPVTVGLLPTGEQRSVLNTPFDFRQATTIGARIYEADSQLRLAGGYDHNFVVAQEPSATPRWVARLHDPASGRCLEVQSTEPGLQLCTGNTLHVGVAGKAGIIYGRCAGVAFETQRFPDSPNQPSFPNAILRPGECFRSRTTFQFSVDAETESAASR